MRYGKNSFDVFLNKPLALGGNYEKPKNLSESKVELLPERINDTSKLAEVIPDNITVSEIAKDRNGNPVFHPIG